jgi:hypothetical protein
MAVLMPWSGRYSTAGSSHGAIHHDFDQGGGMTATIPSPTRVAPPRAPAQAQHSQHRPGLAHDREPLARYRDQEGRERDVVARTGAHGSVLIIDRDYTTLSDCRLVAHLWPDEPEVNARVVADAYVADAHGRRARPLTDDDQVALPGGAQPAPEPEPCAEGDLRDRHGRCYRLAVVDHRRDGRQLRWTRRRGRGRVEPVSVRTVIGALEAYEPARSLTLAAIERGDPEVPTRTLADELRRLEISPFVLNGALREAVQQRVRSGELSLSQIAARCGRGKRLATGLRIGDTSWLGRRIGTLPEAGCAHPAPWIHTDTLALIAREGLGVEPREVELA